MAGIFISYRQADSKAWAISLRDELCALFGDDQVFLDKDALQAGNWREQIRRELAQCRVVLVVIGPRWLSTVDEQNRIRIHLPEDEHHQEIAISLQRADVIVIPVLVEETRMPRKEQLPDDLHGLTECQARTFGDTQPRRKADLSVLAADICSVAGIQPLVKADNADQSAVNAQMSGRAAPAPKVASLTIALFLTLIAAISGYLANAPFNAPQSLFVFLMLWGLVFVVRRIWFRIRGATVVKS